MAVRRFGHLTPNEAQEMCRIEWRRLPDHGQRFTLDGFEPCNVYEAGSMKPFRKPPNRWLDSFAPVYRVETRGAARKHR